MPSIVDECRRKAHEAHVAELETHDPFLRRSYAKLAGHWNELADRDEREEKPRVSKRQPAVHEDTHG